MNKPVGEGVAVVGGGVLVMHGNVLQETLSSSTLPSQVLHLSEKPPPHDLEHAVKADHSPHTKKKKVSSRLKTL